ncbi:MAG: glycosyltransferase family 4 protein [Chthoniobacteraceae bacterium]
MKPWNVLFFDHSARPGGGEIALLRLIAALDRERFHPLVVLGSAGEFQTLLAEAGIEVHYLPLPTGIADVRKEKLSPSALLSAGKTRECWSYARRLAAFMESHHVDLLHTNSLKADLIGAAAARRARVPLIWHVRDRIASDNLSALTASGFRLACRCLPDHIVVNSRATLETLGRAARGKATVVYDGLPFPDFAPVPIPPGPPVIGILGRISPWKGQHVFLNAAAQIRKNFPHARFRIIGAPLYGEEFYEQDLRAMSNRLGLTGAVEFTGFEKDIKREIERLTVLVHASTLPEPFGQVVFEAMYYSRPVVATRAGGVPEIVEDNITGILVPMEDAQAIACAVESLLAAPECARQMGAKGRERVLHYFLAEQSARKIESIYSTLLSD